MAERADLIRAAELTISGDWDAAHSIVQRVERDPLACWLHACLHKIEGEGDVGNARYWYRRSLRRYEDYSDAKIELAAILTALS